MLGPVDLHAGQPLTGDGQGRPCVADRAAGPPHQVGDRSGTVAAEEPQCQLTERLVAVEPARPGHPLVEEHEELLAVLRGTEAQRAGLRQVPEQVIAALTARGHAALGQDGDQRLPAHPAPAGQHADR